MAGRVLATDFDTYVRGVIVEVCDQNLSDELIEMAVILGHGFYLFGKRTDQAVSQKYPKESPDQRAANQLAQDFGRLIN